ncbi:hypothetical protein SRABI84_02680 [Peribacillus simplex]|nr:hypothetical protein SRABI84_02680 [Peribacillus simplex]
MKSQSLEHGLDTYDYFVYLGYPPHPVEPTWDTSAQYKNTVDVTAIWQYLGARKAVWKDATGSCYRLTNYVTQLAQTANKIEILWGSPRSRLWKGNSHTHLQRILMHGTKICV